MIIIIFRYLIIITDDKINPIYFILPINQIIC